LHFIRIDTTVGAEKAISQLAESHGAVGNKCGSIDRVGKSLTIPELYTLKLNATRKGSAFFA
jgi:hypothetical protein